ncbi:MAG TPA: aromatic amino acid hydroxylase [Sphingobacteriaceae bacterium]|nr:aromatic amino acid hydroxylase [Sphingobacteriaceae bacterium]
MTDFNTLNNPQVASLPGYLKQYIVEQNYDHYTPVDHAVWRYVMRQNYSYLKDVAFYPYIPGLEKAGLTIEKIPDMREMNDALAKIGWGAVTVDGFIPPAAFMEFQSYRVLVIAADIRQLNHIEYTPAPDIIHESAGHAPIIADPDYNQYLSYFGSIGAKAMFSHRDFELYEAIRELSILKEIHNADPEIIRMAEKKVEYNQDNLGEPSEMALLSRLHWWTVEYGLIGDLDNHKIYGAGLLSSIGESVTCMQPEVKKLWYTSDAINYSYDITKQQPQLFVTPTFQNLIDVLEKFTDKMAFRVGGAEGVLKAIECKNSCTAVLSSGLQITGVFTDVGFDNKNNVTFIKTTGPSALAFENSQLDGHDKQYHQDGFSSPVGILKNHYKPIEDFSAADLHSAGIEEGNTTSLLFQNGISVTGKIEGLTTQKNKLVLITFSDCMVTDDQGRIYFKPEWGIFDLAVGEKIVSVFCGAADKEAYEEIPLVSNTKTVHTEYDNLSKEYHHLFYTVRKCRTERTNFEELLKVWNQVRLNFREDWLCSLEIFELLSQEKLMPDLAKEIRIYLEMKAASEMEYSKLINDGLRLIHNSAGHSTFIN